MNEEGAFPLLHIHNLSIGFAGDQGIVSAVKSLDLKINRGEIVALVGESGSGKSITALSVLQLLPSPPAVYKSGAIFFSEKGERQIDLLRINNSNKIRGNKIAMIFQEPMSALNPVMTCGKQIAEVLMQHKSLSLKAAKEEAIYWLQKVQIPDPQKAYYKYPHQMSGGQKQRVMIAMAMCCRPQLLLCDEPITALDVTVQQSILQLIGELQAETGMGVLFITHDLGVVAQVAHKAAIMYRGEILETGTTKEIFLAPQHPYTKALIACRPALVPKGVRLPVVADFLEPDAMRKAIEPTPIAASNGSTLLSVKDLVVSFPVKRNLWGTPVKTFNAVDEVSFNVTKGETLGLVGESGCGKTTLGRAILGLVAVKKGSICMEETDITAMDKRTLKKFRKEVQLVFQDPFAALNPRLTISDALEEALLFSGDYKSSRERSKKVSQLLDLVQLPAGSAHRYPHQFSGGQRQRIVIARALAPGPMFLVCDESVSALDVSVQAQVLNLLNDLKRNLNLTLLFISHDLGVVRYISDRLMVMHNGKIIEAGGAEAIFRHPQNAYTRQLLAATPKI